MSDAPFGQSPKKNDTKSLDGKGSDDMQVSSAAGKRNCWFWLDLMDISHQMETTEIFSAAEKRATLALDLVDIVRVVTLPYLDEAPALDAAVERFFSERSRDVRRLVTHVAHNPTLLSRLISPLALLSPLPHSPSFPNGSSQPVAPSPSVPIEKEPTPSATPGRKL
jgi:hypothetical protein